MPFSFTLTDIIPATPQQIYDAWLDSRGHTKMTGSAARAKPVEGATFSAWGGYIKGKNLTLEPGRRIVQSWRTTKFAKQDPRLADRSAAGGGSRGHTAHVAPHQRSGRPCRLSGWRMAATLL